MTKSTLWLSLIHISKAGRSGRGAGPPGIFPGFPRRLLRSRHCLRRTPRPRGLRPPRDSRPASPGPCLLYTSREQAEKLALFIKAERPDGPGLLSAIRQAGIETFLIVCDGSGQGAKGYLAAGGKSLPGGVLFFSLEV